MSTRDKVLFFVKVLVITSILFILTIVAYFMWFYKQKGITAFYDEFFREFYLLWFMLCLIVSMFILMFHQEIVFYYKPVLEVNASLKSKEEGTYANVGTRGGMTVMYTYKLIFELDNGTEMSFIVNPEQYMTMLEGNRGILKYKEAIAKRYIGFYVTEIE